MSGSFSVTSSSSMPPTALSHTNDVIHVEPGQVIQFDDSRAFLVVDIEQDKVRIRDKNHVDYFFTPDVTHSDHLSLVRDDGEQNEREELVRHLNRRANVSILSEEEAEQFKHEMALLCDEVQVGEWVYHDETLCQKSDGEFSKSLVTSVCLRSIDGHCGYHDKSTLRLRRAPAEIAFWANRYVMIQPHLARDITLSQVIDATRLEVIDEVAKAVQNASPLPPVRAQLIAEYAVIQPRGLLAHDREHIEAFDNKLNKTS